MNRRDGHVRYNDGHRRFDATATADDMQECADGYRRGYQEDQVFEGTRLRRIADAAYCQSLADRKRRGE